MSLLEQLARLGASEASGILAIDAPTRTTLFAVRRGHVVAASAADAEARLEQAVTTPGATLRFTVGAAACPPGTKARVALLDWARAMQARLVTRGRPRGEDCYATLGVDPDATARTLRRAYHQRAREHHPDLRAPVDQRDVDGFARIADAYHAALAALE